MAPEPRQGNQYGDVKIDGQASLWQGDDNRIIGIVQIENAHFAFHDAQNFQYELFSQLNATQQKHDHLGGRRNSYLPKPCRKQSGHSGSLRIGENYEYEEQILGIKCMPREGANAVSTGNPVKDVLEYERPRWFVETLVMNTFQPRVLSAQRYQLPKVKKPVNVWVCCGCGNSTIPVKNAACLNCQIPRCSNCSILRIGK